MFYGLVGDRSPGVDYMLGKTDVIQGFTVPTHDGAFINVLPAQALTATNPAILSELQSGAHGMLIFKGCGCVLHHLAYNGVIKGSCRYGYS